MTIFLGLMATLFAIFTLNENGKDKRETYALCFSISVLGMIALKVLQIVL